MSKVKVQCKGSGKALFVSLNAKRGTCPSCGRVQDLTGKGRVRKHDRIMSKSRLRRLS